MKKCIRELSFSLVSLCALSDEISLSAEVLIGFQPSGILLTCPENNKHIHHCTSRSAPLHNNTDTAQINHFLNHQDPSLLKAHTHIYIYINLQFWGKEKKRKVRIVRQKKSNYLFKCFIPQPKQKYILRIARFKIGIVRKKQYWFWNKVTINFFIFYSVAETRLYAIASSNIMISVLFWLKGLVHMDYFHGALLFFYSFLSLFTFILCK